MPGHELEVSPPRPLYGHGWHSSKHSDYPRDHFRPERESKGVGCDILITKKLFLETMRNINSGRLAFMTQCFSYFIETVKNITNG